MRTFLSIEQLLSASMIQNDTDSSFQVVTTIFCTYASTQSVNWEGEGLPGVPGVQSSKNSLIQFVIIRCLLTLQTHKLLVIKRLRQVYCAAAMLPHVSSFGVL